MPDPKALTPMFNAREEPFPMIEDRDGRLVAAVKDYAYAKKSAQMLNDILDTAVAAERERVLAEVGAIAAEGVVSMNTTQQSIDKAIRRRDWGEVCGYIADLYGGRLALNAILAAANPSNPIKEGGEG